MTAEVIRRPNSWQRVRWAAGLPMPTELRPWVRRDLSSRGSAARHVVRNQLLFAPVYVVFLLFPGELYIRLLMILLAALLGAVYAVIYGPQNRAQRLRQNGLPADLVSEQAQHRLDDERTRYEMTYRGGS